MKRTGASRVAATFRELGQPMATHIGECQEFTAQAVRDEDRFAGVFDGEVVAYSGVRRRVAALQRMRLRPVAHRRQVADVGVEVVGVLEAFGCNPSLCPEF